MKFQVSPATGCAGSYRKETSVEGRGGGLGAASFLRAFGSKNGGPEATATVFRQSLGEGRIQL